MLYQEFPPGPPLRAVVASYWRFTLPASLESASIQHTVPPDGTVSLTWLPTGQLILVGPRVTALHVAVKAGAEYLGVRLLPGSAGPLLGVDVKTMREIVRPFNWPDFERAISTAGLPGINELLLETCCRPHWQGPDPVVAELTRRILDSDGATPVASLIGGLNLGYRQVLRRFHEASGLTPKEFARIRRIRAACLESLDRADPAWAQVSIEAGFADQAHLSREFRDIFRLASQTCSRIPAPH